MTIYNEENIPFASNPESRCPVVLICDTSYSMEDNDRITSLNNGIKQLFAELQQDSLAQKRVDIMLIQCGGNAKVAQPFVTVKDVVDLNANIPEFIASGGTPMDDALNLAMSELDDRKQLMKSTGIGYYRPWIIAISDGEFDVSKSTLQRLHCSERESGHLMFSIGVGGDACPSSLTGISAKGRGYMINDMSFGELFSFVSSSLRSVSQSTPSDRLSLSVPNTIKVVENAVIDI